MVTDPQDGAWFETMRVGLAAVVFACLLGACADAVTTPAASEPPIDLEIRCDGTTTEVLTPTVQAQRDGVHVLIRNVSDEELSVSTESQGTGASPGETTLVFPIHPGTSRIRCQKETEDASMEKGDWGSFDVLAERGWVSPELVCPSGAMYQRVADYIEGARGVDDPLADAAKRFRLPGEAVEAGYRTEEERTFVNMTDDGPKESLVYRSDGDGGWLQSESSGCSD